MTFENRMKTAKILIAQGVTADKDLRVKEYEDRQNKINAQKREQAQAKKQGAKK